jgi:hypothetical protein
VWKNNNCGKRSTICIEDYGEVEQTVNGKGSGQVQRISEQHVKKKNGGVEEGRETGRKDVERDEMPRTHQRMRLKGGRGQGKRRDEE